ncbi:cohesin domain-containing protein [Noviherbaspirillum soli]|uniref:cohesin domain-containing protein n=1 Tax=Noviherbaspirillum soli TaxID=1064518 RepID=UPI00188D74A0|nr:cohesin domain-containing protein [Noviherbaspirillum soli]
MHRKILIVCIGIGMLLAGCAGQDAYLSGRKLLAEGNAFASLEKFQEALRQAPRAAPYRTAYLAARERAVADIMAQAGQAEQAARWSEARGLYLRVLQAHPANEPARAALQSLDVKTRHAGLLKQARQAMDSKDPDSAMATLRVILTEDPQQEEALKLRRLLAGKADRAAAEPALATAYKMPVTIEFREASLKQVFEVLSRTSGLNFLFDKDVKTEQKTSIFLKNSTVAAAVHFILLTNQLEQQVLDANTILVYPNTAAKQKDYQEMMVKTFFLANADARTVANSLKTIARTRDVVVDEKLNLLIVRDSPEAIGIAEKLVAIQDLPEPEVMLEVEILEVKRTRLMELGVKWPDTLTLTPLPASAGAALTMRDLGGLNAAGIGASLAPAIINARQQDSDANILANPRIRARNHEKAKILIGERVPNITTTSTATGFVSEAINYVDVGLKLDVEPTIYLDGDVAIKVALEVSNIVSQLQTKSGTVAYQIGTRTASTVLRLKDGENQVLAGLINDEDRNSASKLPFLGNIPLVGRLFGSRTDNNQKTEIVLSITPRIIHQLHRPQAELAQFRAGTENSLRNRPDGVPAASAGPAVGQAKPVLTPAATRSSPALTAPAAPAAGQNSDPRSMAVSDPGYRTAQADASPGSQNGLAAAGAEPSFLQWQGPAQVNAGNSLFMQIVVQARQPVVSLPLTVEFDHKVLQVIMVAEGEWLKTDNAQTSFSSRVEPQGQVTLNGQRNGADGAIGSGVFATIQFRALGPVEASSIRLSRAAPVGANGQSIPMPLPAAHLLRILP